MLRLALGLVLVLTGCGSDSSSSDKPGPAVSAAAPSKWTDAEVIQGKANCLESAKAARDANNTGKTDAALYVSCSCLIEASAQRWTLADYVAHETQYVEQLKADGTIAKCGVGG
jgi:hypothetical protein